MGKKKQKARKTGRSESSWKRLLQPEFGRESIASKEISEEEFMRIISESSEPIEKYDYCFGNPEDENHLSFSLKIQKVK